MNKRYVYLDYAATTPLSEAAFSAMKPYLSHNFGNADSLHAYGSKAAAALSGARRTVAACLGASPAEIFFTSGGTEANNWAIKGIAQASHKATQASKKDLHNPPHIIISAVEHPSVMQPAARLEEDGFRVTKLCVNGGGLVSSADLEAAILPETCLISVMLANNEIGTIQPIEQLCAVAKARSIPFHTDAVQAAGTLALDVKQLGVDLLTISAHKFYGPKGIGALYIHKDLTVRPEPLIDGGKQEREQRGGTSNVAAAVGMATAFFGVTERVAENYNQVRQMRDTFVSKIESEIPYVRYNGDRRNRLPQNANISFCGIAAGEMLALLDLYGVAAASGSACSSGSTEPSHVLTALGVSGDDARSAVRFSFGVDTTLQDVDYAVAQIKKAVEKLRACNHDLR